VSNEVQDQTIRKWDGLKGRGGTRDFYGRSSLAFKTPKDQTPESAVDRIEESNAERRGPS
jgi:hypothetical protein